jgi:4-amino-4-deoxy-L-arabinose transferase-like glycosyltransferase
MGNLAAKPSVPRWPALRARLLARVGRAEAAAALLAAFFALASLAWICLDRAPPLWDEAQYLLESELLFHTWSDAGAAAFLSAFSRTMAIKAPLITVLPLPLYSWFGEGMRAARAVNVVFIVLAGWYLFRLGTELVGRRAALLAVLFLNTFPLVAGLSRPLMVEYGLMSLVIAWMYGLVRWRQGAERAAPWVLGALLGIGLLMKVSFPLYVAAPTVLVLVGDVVRHRRLRAVTVAGACHLAAVGAAIAAIWYAKNWRSALGFVAEGGFGKVAHQFTNTLGGYWLAWMDEALGAFCGLLLLAVLAGWALAAANGRRVALIARQYVDLWLAWWAVPALALSSAVNRDTRYTMAYLPAVALLLGAGCARLAEGRRGKVAVGVIAASSLAIYGYYSFAAGESGYRPRVAGLASPIGITSWAHPPLRERWPGHDVVALIDRDARASMLESPTVIVLFTHRRINAHNLSYLAALARSPARFRIWYVHSMDPAAAARSIERNANYVLTQSPLAMGLRINEQSAEVLASLRASGFPFVPVADFTLPDGSQLAVFRALRDRPVVRRAPARLLAAGGPVAEPLAEPAVDPAAPRFGGWIALASSRVDCETEGCRITLGWLCLAPMNEDYRVFVHVYDEIGTLTTIADFTPTRGKHPTSRWRPGDLIEDEVLLEHGLPEGFQVYVGWYRVTPRWRLPLTSQVAPTRGRPNALRVH